MPPLLRFLLRRLLSIPVSLIIVTMMLYAVIMLIPAEERAALYLPGRIPPEQINQVTERIIERHHLRDPFPVQYASWLSSLARGEWGFSITLHEDVLAALLRRTPVTAELTLYSLLLFIPLGLAAGALAGWKKNSRFDLSFRNLAFAVTTLPPFILAILLMGIFYVRLGWFPPERLGYAASQIVQSEGFRSFTGLLTVDGLLNGEFDVTLDALRHLALPVISLSFLHLANLGQITRIAMIEEAPREYIAAGRAHGLSERRLLWRHAFRNVLAPALTGSALSAAALFTGVIVIERTFNLKGVSEMILSVREIPDAASVLGFAVYSISVVLLLMFVLDLIQALYDPRVRESILNP